MRQELVLRAQQKAAESMLTLWERKSLSSLSDEETLQRVLRLLIISVPSKSSRLSCASRLAWPRQFSDFGRREREKVSMNHKRALNQGAKYEYQ